MSLLPAVRLQGLLDGQRLGIKVHFRAEFRKSRRADTQAAAWIANPRFEGRHLLVVICRHAMFTQPPSSASFWAVRLIFEIEALAFHHVWPLLDRV